MTSFSSESMFPRGKGVFGACREVSEFKKEERIGSGAYGTVYRAVDLKGGNRVVALKRVILHNEQQDGFPLTSLREIQILRRISHPNCVTLLDVVVGRKRDSVFLVFEYCDHDLAALLDSVSRPFTESEIKCLMLQLLRAIDYLHDNWVIHRDLKMSNLLYTNRGELKLADFGLARAYGHPPRPLTPKVVTLWYRCPELLLGCDTYTTAVDDWAAGCILGELLGGKPLLAGKSEADQLRLMFELLGSPNARIWPDFPRLPHVASGRVTVPQTASSQFNNLRTALPGLSGAGEDLMNCLLTFDPKKRVSAHRALGHDYFREKPYPKEPGLMPTFASTHKHKNKS